MQGSRQNTRRRRVKLVGSSIPLGRCLLIYSTCSGVHHLEEIRESGMEMPAVNQIEVRWNLDPRRFSSEHQI